MVVLWRNNENTSEPGARYNALSVRPNGSLADKNTFLEKHVRLYTDKIPVDNDLMNIAEDVYFYRNAYDGAKIPSLSGPMKAKSVLFGRGRPEISTVYFMTLKGFQATNAWIEEKVTRSSENVWVPIFADGAAVTYDGYYDDFQIVRAGYIRADIKVGKETSFKIGSMQSKIVYHLRGVEKSPK